MKPRTIFAAVLLALSFHALLKASDTENGETDDRLFAFKQNAKGSFEHFLWRDCVGKKVEAQGIAWGGNVKPYQQYIIFDGVRIFLTGKLPPTDDVQGRIVKAIGVLKVLPEPNPADYRPPQLSFIKRYYITVDTMSVADHAEHLDLLVLSE